MARYRRTGFRKFDRVAARLGSSIVAIVLCLPLYLLAALLRMSGSLFVSRCDICDNIPRRGRYKWNVGGRTAYVCPTCNRTLEQKKSRAAFNPNEQISFPTVRRRLGCGGALLVVLGVALIASFIEPLVSPRSGTTSSSSTATPGLSPRSSVTPAVSASPAAKVAPQPSAPIFPRAIRATRPNSVTVQYGVIRISPGEEFTVLSQEGQTVRARFHDYEFTLPASEVAAALPITATSPSPLKAALRIRSELVRIGEWDPFKADLLNYEKSGLVGYTEFRLVSPEQQLIRVPYQKAVEIELTYDLLELADSGIFSKPSKFEFLSQSGTWSSVPDGLGSLPSHRYNVSATRAILTFNPWLQVPDGAGGKTKARLILKTKDGSQFTREWTIQVGRNPKSHKEIW